MLLTWPIPLGKAYLLDFVWTQICSGFGGTGVRDSWVAEERLHDVLRCCLDTSEGSAGSGSGSFGGFGGEGCDVRSLLFLSASVLELLSSVLSL